VFKPPPSFGGEGRVNRLKIKLPPMSIAKMQKKAKKIFPK